MTAPERVRLKPCSPCDGDEDWYVALTPGGVEYVRDDVSTAEMDALRAEIKLANEARDRWQDIAMEEMSARVATEAELTKAANRIEWCAGILSTETARDTASGWVAETRAALAAKGGE